MPMRERSVESERPAPPVHERQVQRPFYLVAAMVLVWILGIRSLIDGATTSLVLREGSLPDAFAIARSSSGELQDVFVPILSAARITALAAAAQLSFPLGVGRALLASTLVVASTLVLLGRPSARTFAFQALGANALFAILEYVLLRHVRGAWVDIAARAIATIQESTLPPGTVELTRFWGYWMERLRLFFFELGVPFVAAIALLRPRTKIYFAEAAAAAESAEEEP